MSLLPSQLSPSSAGDFQQCPKLFHFKKVLGRPSYSNQASAAGRLSTRIQNGARYRRERDVRLTIVQIRSHSRSRRVSILA